MPTIKPEDQEQWGVHKEEILGLYVNQDRPLKDVIRVMAHRGFRKTKPQYERIFRKWGITKNIREDEWSLIFSSLDQRKAEGKISEVKVRGVTLSQAKLRKQRSKQYQSVHDRLFAQSEKSVQPRELPGIEVSTPPAQADVGVISEDVPYHEQVTPTVRSDNVSSPLAQFSEPLPGSIESIHQNTDSLSEEAARDDPSLAKQSLQVVSSRGLPIENEIECSSDRLLTAWKWLSSMLSVPWDGQFEGHDAVAQLSQRTESYIIRLKISTSLQRLANEPVDHQKAVLQRIAQTRDSTGLQILRYFFNLGDVFIWLFAKKTLPPAIEVGNLPLVELLLDSSATPHDRVPFPGQEDTLPDADVPHITALQLAVLNRQEDIILCLLQRGADNRSGILQATNRFVSGSILDVIIEMGTGNEGLEETETNRKSSCDILYSLLDYSAHMYPTDTLLRALRHAVLRGRLDLLEILFAYWPILDLAHERPWILLEAASTLKSLEMITALVDRGYDLAATDKDGLGSAVAVAAKHSNTHLLSWLVSKKVNLDGLAYGLSESRNDLENLTISEERLKDVRGMTALQIAVQRGHESFIRMLLHYGATPTDSILMLSNGQPRKAVQPDPVTILYDAITDDNLLLIEQLLDHAKSTQIHLSEQDRIKALIIATRDNNIAAVHILLSANVSPYDEFIRFPVGSSCLSSGTAFENAIESQRTILIAMFLSYPLTKLSSEQKTARKEQLCAAYTRAICRGNMEPKDIIAESYLEVSEIDEIMDCVQYELTCALREAVRSQDFRQVTRLIGAGAEPDFMNRESWVLKTPLDFAVSNNDVDMVKELLEAGALPYKRASSSITQTPLRTAASIGNLDMIEVLLDAKADVNEEPTGFISMTALEAAAALGHLQAFRRILHAGADWVGNNGTIYTSILDGAKVNGHYEIVAEMERLLSDAGGILPAKFTDLHSTA